MVTVLIKTLHAPYLSVCPSVTYPNKHTWIKGERRRRVTNQCALCHILKTVLLLWSILLISSWTFCNFVSNFYCNVLSSNCCRILMSYRKLIYMHFLTLCSTKTTGEQISWDHRPIRVRLNKLQNLGVHRECTLHCLITSSLSFLTLFFEGGQLFTVPKGNSQLPGSAMRLTQKRG